MSNIVDSPSSSDSDRPNKTIVNLKRQLTLYLKRNNLTAAELSRQSGVPKQTISLWLGGSKPRRLDHLKNVALVLNTSVDHLAFGSGFDESMSDTSDISDIIGENWVGGLFEIKLRRIRREK